MIDIPKVEFASCARDLISGWNLTTMNWLRRWAPTTVLSQWSLLLYNSLYKLAVINDIKYYWFFCRLVYDRGDRSVLLTNMASAIWHGYYPGYYVSFVFAGVGTLAGRKV